MPNEIETRSNLYQEILDGCKFVLKTDPIAAEARSYLNQRIPAKFQSKFEFGYFPSDEYLSYITSIVDIDVLKNSGLLYSKKVSGGDSLTGHFRHHNLIFPFRDMYGNIVSFVGRTFFNSEKQSELEIPKYKYNYGFNKEMHVFNLNDVRQSIIEKDYVVIVEGQFDAMVGNIFGLNNVVAIGGATLLKYQFFLLRRYTKNFILLFDSDEAGLRGSEKALKKYKAYGNIYSKVLPNGFKDIDSFLKSREVDISNKKKFISEIVNIDNL